MSCYLLRKQSKLPNSISLGETANDLLVASRQKHQGMSWFKISSHSLAKLTELIVNKKLKPTILGNSVNFYAVQRM